MCYVYLLHFSQPITAGHPCQHYLGFAYDLVKRLADHRAGRGARLTQVALERGIVFDLVRWWPGDRTLERTLKNYRQAPRLCPMCCAAANRRVWTPRACQAVGQLALPLDDAADDWDFGDVPDDRPTRMDFFEYSFRRSLRPSPVVPVRAFPARDDSELF